MNSGRVPADLARIVRQRAGDCCEYCRLPQWTQEATFHLDHITPRIAGGKTDTENLALACVTCSLRKAARRKARNPNSGKLVSIFDPRRQRWSQHFAWSASWRVKGKTPTGRATLVALGMNRAAIVAIRRRLAALEGFQLDEGFG